MQLVLFKKKLNIKHCINLLINTINIFVLSCALVIRPIPVYAVEDTEIIVVSDPSTWGAFKLFSQYNWNSSFENTETQTFSTSGQSTITGEFTFSGQFSGSFAANVNLAYTGSIGDSGLGVASIISTENIHIGSTANPSQTIEMTIHPEDYQTDQNNGFAFACTYNTQSTSTAAVMTCSPTSGAAETVILPDQTITVDTLEVYGGVQGTYLVKMLNEGTETGSIAGSLSGSIGGGGQVTLAESYNETTTTTNNTKYEFTLPYMIHDGDLWKPITEYNVKYNIGGGSKDDPLVVAFMSDSILLYFMRLYLCNNNRQEIGSNQTKRTNRYLVGNSIGYQLNCIEYFNGASVYIDVMQSVHTTGIKLYPLYVGRKSYMSDELYRFIYGSDRTIEVLTDGNADSQTAQNNIDSAGTGFDQAGNDLIDLEDNTFSSMDTAIDNVNLDNNLVSNSGFLNAATWVRTQFENLISYSPIQNILVFSLSLGFALLIIGKVR